MRSIAALALACALLLARADRPALADAAAHVPGSAAVPSDAPASLDADADAPPLPLDELRTVLGRRGVRVSVGGARFEIARAHLDEAGLAFDAGDPLGVPASAADGASWKQRHATRLQSPVSWSRIDGIETRKSGAGRGALVGALIPVALFTGVAMSPDTDEGLGFAVMIPAAIVTGALVGALVGKGITQWKSVWRRPGLGARAAG